MSPNHSIRCIISGVSLTQLIPSWYVGFSPSQSEKLPLSYVLLNSSEFLWRTLSPGIALIDLL